MSAQPAKKAPAKKKKRPAPIPAENVYPVLAAPGHVVPVFLGLGLVLAVLALVFFAPPPGPGHFQEKASFLALVICALLCAWIAFGTRQLRVEVVGRELRVRGDLFFKKIDAGSIRIDRARIVNLASDPDCGLTWRLYGAAIPGYTTGLYVLRRGGRAWTLVTDRRSVLWLPTTEGYTLLLSLERADHLLARLQKFAALREADVEAEARSHSDEGQS